MIVDLRRFLAAEEPYWNELAGMLAELEARVERELSLDESKHFMYLYQRASADLAKLATLPYEPRIREYLEPLVARAYAEIHEARDKPRRFSPRQWLFKTFPQTFRRHATAFAVSVAITLVGVVFGATALAIDSNAKRILMPFPQLLVNPHERVQYEESQSEDRLHGQKTSFSAFLMTHNTQVAIMAMAFGMSWGLGTILLLFSNGVMLGAVVCDYIMAGEGPFVAGWLLPHGAFEIPAIVIAGQAGLILGATLIGRGTSMPVKARLRQAAPDLVTLLFGVALMLVWAGIVEAFFSQYHAPVLPYWLKIAFGVLELVLLTLFLCRAGKDVARISIRESRGDKRGLKSAPRGA